MSGWQEGGISLEIVFFLRLILSFLVAGDEILSVNGRGVQGLSHQQAIQLFRNIKSGQIVILVARRVLQVKK